MEWFHYKCVGLNVKMVEAMGTESYICSSCKTSASSTVPMSDNELTQSQASTEDSQDSAKVVEVVTEGRPKRIRNPPAKLNDYS